MAVREVRVPPINRTTLYSYRLSSFDKEGYSIWRVDFKYNEELDLIFKSSNQITGFFNRLEASRKYLFASVGVLGENNNSIITGALIARGQEIKPNVDCAPDWESYSYERLDLENPEHKAFFEGALAWDLEVDGKKWVDGKNVSLFVYFEVHFLLRFAAAPPADRR